MIIYFLSKVVRAYGKRKSAPPVSSPATVGGKAKGKRGDGKGGRKSLPVAPRVGGVVDSLGDPDAEEDNEDDEVPAKGRGSRGGRRGSVKEGGKKRKKGSSDEEGGTGTVLKIKRISKRTTVGRDQK